MALSQTADQAEVLLCVRDANSNQHWAVPLSDAGHAPAGLFVAEWQGRSAAELTAADRAMSFDTDAIVAAFREHARPVEDSRAHDQDIAASIQVFSVNEKLIAVFVERDGAAPTAMVLPRAAPRPTGERARATAVATLLTPPAVAFDTAHTAVFLVPTVALYYAIGEQDNFDLSWGDGPSDWPPPLAEAGDQVDE